MHIGAGILFLGCAVLMWIRKEEADDEHGAKAAKQRGFLASMVSAFVVVFVAEWGDLTQIATAGFQAKYGAWLIIFAASSLALWTVAALAVFVGNRAGKLFDRQLTQRVAALVFVVIGVLLIAGVL